MPSFIAFPAAYDARFWLAITPLAGHKDSGPRESIRRCLEALGSVSGIDVFCYDAMYNHLRVIFKKLRPNVVVCWSDEEVEIGWWRLFPGC